MRPLALSLEFRRRLHQLAWLTWASGALTAAVTILALSAAADYLCRFGFTIRALMLGLAFAAAVSAWRLLGRRHRSAATATEAAIEVERLRRSRDSLFLTGVEAEDDRTHGDPQLAERIADRAAATVTEAFFARLDRRVLRRAQRLLAVTLCLALGFAALAPEAALRHLGRILLPFARIAPATATRLAIAPGEVTVRDGESVEIRLTATGALPLAAELEARDETGTLSRFAMQPAGGDSVTRVFTVDIENICGPLVYRVIAGDAISFDYRLACLRPPRLESLRVRVIPPAWLAAPDTVLDAPAEVRLLRGGSLEYELTATQPLAAAVFRFATSAGMESRALAVAGATVRWRQTPTDSGVADCELTGENGAGAPLGLGLVVTLLEDAPPELIVLSPQPKARAVVSEEIPFLAALRDDHGLQECRVLVAISAETEALWRAFPLAGDTARLEFDLPLEEFVLEPGDVVHVRLEARDRNPEGRATSRSRAIQVVPYERYYRYQSSLNLPPGFATLAPRLRQFIERQKALIDRTTAALGRAEELGDCGTAEERLRADLRQELEKCYEAMRQEDPLNRDRHVLDNICMKAEAAAREMGKAVTRLQQGEGEPALRDERAALAELMKSLSALLTIVSPEAPQGGESEPTEEQFEDLPPPPEEPREAEASPETTGEKEAAAAQSLLDQAEKLRREGKATPEELERLAAEAEKLASEEAKGAQGSSGAGEGKPSEPAGAAGERERARGEESGRAGETPRAGERRGEEGRQGGEEAGQGGQRRGEEAGQGGQRRGEEAGQGGQRRGEEAGQGGQRRGEERNRETGPGRGRRTGQRGEATAGGSESAQNRDRAGATDGTQPTGERPAGTTERRTGASGRLTDQTAEQWRNLAATGDRQGRARRLNEIAARLRELARQGRTGSLASGRLVDELEALINVLTEIRDLAEARQLARAMLEELTVDPESIPAELRELVRRYFEMLNR